MVSFPSLEEFKQKLKEIPAQMKQEVVWTPILWSAICSCLSTSYLYPPRLYEHLTTPLPSWPHQQQIPPCLLQNSPAAWLALFPDFFLPTRVHKPNQNAHWTLTVHTLPPPCSAHAVPSAEEALCLACTHPHFLSGSFKIQFICHLLCEALPNSLIFLYHCTPVLKLISTLWGLHT